MSAALALALIIGALAAWFDVRSRRIPNWLTFGSLLAAFGLNSWQAGWSGAQATLAGAALGLGLLLPFYVVRAVGAGDVKLLAALGALLGVHTLVSVAVYGALVGGVMSLALLVWRGDLVGSLREAVGSLSRPRRSGLTAPYGVAIASGVYLSCVLPGVLG